MTITEMSYKWNGSLAPRSSTNYIVLHHRAGNGTAESIHTEHISKCWAGIGYHFYIRKDGSIYRGRPLDRCGAHCIPCNASSVGICFEGNFETETMSAAQKKSGRELVTYLRGIYPKAELKRHKDMDSTACPGKNFPFEEIGKGAVGTAKELTSGNDIVWELMHGSYAVEISDVPRAVKAIDRAKADSEYCSLYWILRKLVNKTR